MLFEDKNIILEHVDIKSAYETISFNEKASNNYITWSILQRWKLTPRNLTRKKVRIHWCVLILIKCVK